MIEAERLAKAYKIYGSGRGRGWGEAIRGVFARPYEVKEAVKGVSFRIRPGELVGFIGPNGAGKSTTIKMLSGVLTPTSGKVRVNGCIPSEDRRRNGLQIGVVFGQRSQLFWDLPMEETFLLHRRMYRIPSDQFRRNVDFMVELLEMEGFYRTPVRQLSLGQKMRANLAAALLHDPAVLYLDEPTIGLDVVAKAKIRRFLRELNEEKRTTVILTTHDMDDIDEVCERLMLIDRGTMIHDGPLAEFKRRYSEGPEDAADLERIIGTIYSRS